MSPGHATTYSEVPDATDALLVPKSPCTRKRSHHSWYLIESAVSPKSHERREATQWRFKPLCLTQSRMPANYRAPLARNTPSSAWRWSLFKVWAVLQRRLPRETSPELFTPTLLTVQNRNHCSGGNSNERRESHHSLSVKARCIRQDTHRSSRYPEMPQKDKKWCLGAECHLVRECPTCIKTKTNRAEPMIPLQLPEHPFQNVGTDLFEWKGQEFVLVADYFSRVLLEFQKPWSSTTDHGISQRNSPNLLKTGDSHTLQAVQKVFHSSSRSRNHNSFRKKSQGPPKTLGFD